MDELRRSFSHGSSMDSTNVASNHILRRQKKTASLDVGRLVCEWSGFGGGRFAGGRVETAMALNPRQRFESKRSRFDERSNKARVLSVCTPPSLLESPERAFMHCNPRIYHKESRNIDTASLALGPLISRTGTRHSSATPISHGRYTA
jgi:hypothetical protein